MANVGMLANLQGAPLSDCTTDLLFAWFGFGYGSKSVVISIEQSYRIETI